MAGLALLAAALLAGSPAAAGESAGDRERAARLAAELGSEEFAARERATAELRKLGAAAREALEKAAASQDLEVRTRAEMLLAEIRWQLPPELAAGLGEFGRNFTRDYLAAPDPDVRVVLLHSLRARAPRPAEAYILQALKEAQLPGIRGQLLSLLRIYRGPEALAAVLAASRDEDPECRTAAADALESFPNEAAFQRLVELAGDEAVPVRIKALYSLGGRGLLARKAAPAVLKALGSQEIAVRTAAVNAAAGIGARQAMDRIWELAGDEEDRDRVRGAAFYALAALAAPGEEAVANRLATMLISDLPAVRFAALDALEEMRGRSAAPAVAELLSGEDTSTAIAAARALAFIGGPGQAAALRRCLDNPRDPDLAIAAARALVALGEKAAVAKIAPLLQDDRHGESAAEVLAQTGQERWLQEIARLTGREMLLVRAEGFRDLGAVVMLLRQGGSRRGWSEWALFAEAADETERVFPHPLTMVRRSRNAAADDPQALAEAGYFLARAGKMEEGKARLRDAVEFAPMDADVLNTAAWTLLTCGTAEQREPAEALKLAARAADIEPRSSAILDTHAWALFAAGRNQEALGRIDEALLRHRARRLCPGAVLEVHRARILLRLSRREEADQALAAALERAPRDPETAAEAARFHCDAGRPARAVAELKRMVELAYPDAAVLRDDPELASARADAGFPAVLEAAGKLRDRLRAQLPGREAGAAGEPDAAGEGRAPE